MSDCLEFRCRAECERDVRLAVRKLRAIAAGKGLFFSAKMRPLGLGEQEVAIRTEMPMDRVVRIIREVPDSHVMVETFAPKDEYVGVRTFLDKPRYEVDRDGHED